MNWTTKPPTKPGHYWFFGDNYMGCMGQDYTDEATVEPRMVLVEVNRCVNGFIAVANGHFVSLRQFDKSRHQEGYVGYWAPAELPKPPTDRSAFAPFNVSNCENQFDNLEPHGSV